MAMPPAAHHQHAAILCAPSHFPPNPPSPHAPRSGCWARAQSSLTVRRRRRWAKKLTSLASCPAVVARASQAQGCWCRVLHGTPRMRRPALALTASTSTPAQELPVMPAERRAVPHARERGALPILPVPCPGKAGPSRACRLQNPAPALSPPLARLSVQFTLEGSPRPAQGPMINAHSQQAAKAGATLQPCMPFCGPGRPPVAASRRPSSLQAARPPSSAVQRQPPRACPSPPLQSEYNRMKPTTRNEFQTSNLKTAFRPGMQRGGGLGSPHMQRARRRSSCPCLEAAWTFARACVLQRAWQAYSLPRTPLDGPTPAAAKLRPSCQYRVFLINRVRPCRPSLGSGRV